MTSIIMPPYDGLHSATMDGTTSSELARVSESLKAILSSDWQAATRLHEAGIANRGSARRSEYVPGLACNHHEFAAYPKSVR